MYDNTCKYLAENFPEDISNWLLGVRVSLIQMQPTELSVEPIRADSMILLTNHNLILHVEFQTVSDREMGFRMLDYQVRAHRKFPGKQILRRDIMRESVIYQDILAEGEIKSEGKWRVEEARGLVIRQLTRKLGNVTPNLLAKIQDLPLERVESLSEDLLDFTSIANLEQWLSQN